MPRERRIENPLVELQEKLKQEIQKLGLTATHLDIWAPSREGYPILENFGRYSGEHCYYRFSGDKTLPVNMIAAGTPDHHLELTVDGSFRSYYHQRSGSADHDGHYSVTAFLPWRIPASIPFKLVEDQALDFLKHLDSFKFKLKEGVPPDGLPESSQLFWWRRNFVVKPVTLDIPHLVRADSGRPLIRVSLPAPSSALPRSK